MATISSRRHNIEDRKGHENEVSTSHTKSVGKQSFLYSSSVRPEDERAVRSDVNGELGRHGMNEKSGGNSDHDADREQHGGRKAERIGAEKRYMTQGRAAASRGETADDKAGGITKER